MVAFSDEQEVKKFIEDNNLSECELGFILAFLIESLRKSSCSKVFDLKTIIHIKKLIFHV